MPLFFQDENDGENNAHGNKVGTDVAADNVAVVFPSANVGC